MGARTVALAARDRYPEAMKMIACRVGDVIRWFEVRLGWRGGLVHAHTNHWMDGRPRPCWSSMVGWLLDPRYPGRSECSLTRGSFIPIVGERRLRHKVVFRARASSEVSHGTT